MRHTTVVPVVPPALELLLRPLPLFPLRLALQQVAESLGRRRAGLFTRLGDHTGKVFLIDPTDLPFVLRLKPNPAQPTVEPRRRQEAGHWDARIAGPLAALIGMVHGAFDGDALFFSRDIVIEGDTEAVLALRNTLDNAEIDLPAEIAAAFGPIGSALEPIARRVLPAMSRLPGFKFMRADGA